MRTSGDAAQRSSDVCGGLDQGLQCCVGLRTGPAEVGPAAAAQVCRGARWGSWRRQAQADVGLDLVVLQQAGVGLEGLETHQVGRLNLRVAGGEDASVVAVELEEDARPGIGQDGGPQVGGQLVQVLVRGCPEFRGTWVAIRGEPYAAAPTVSGVWAVVSG